MTAMTQTFRPGELVNVQLRGVRYERTGAAFHTLRVGGDGAAVSFNVPVAVSHVERVAPKEWPPEPGDVWAGRDEEWLAVQERGGALLLINAAAGFRWPPETVTKNDGPVRLVRRRGWTPELPDAEPGRDRGAVDQRAKLVADLRAVADWIEQHTDLPVNGMREHDMSVTYYAGSPSRLQQVAELIGAEVTTDDAGHMHAVAEIHGRSYRAFHVPAAVLDDRARKLDKPVDCCPDAAEEPPGPASTSGTGPAGPIAPHGCDDCCAEPGEPHAWPGCPGAAANVPAEAGGETVEDAEVTPLGGER